MKTKVILTLAVSAAVGLVGCGSRSANVSVGSQEKKQITSIQEQKDPTKDPANYPISDEKMEPISSVGVKITGTLTNNSGADAKMIMLTYGLYGEDGAKLGTAVATINNLGNGEKWNFEASSLHENAVTYKLDGLTIY